MEALVTFLLMFVVMGVATDDRANKAAHPLGIGLALGIGVLVAGPVTGGAVNPARALGPMIAAAKFPAWWLYLIAPAVGAIVAALVYNALREITSGASGSRREQRNSRR
jgi:glycerol uptake facilitator-like aquaporin